MLVNAKVDWPERGSLCVAEITVCSSAEYHIVDVETSGLALPIAPAGMVRVIEVP
jgi:hypothetical protein